MKKTAGIPAVQEAAKAASGHVQYYQSMMQQAKASTASHKPTQQPTSAIVHKK